MTANIPPNPDNIEDCKKLCSLSLSYNLSKCTVKNNGNHLSLGYDDNNGSQVVFNKSHYKIKDIKLFSPSVNKYNNQQAACELVIIHQNNYLDYVAICIPIKKGIAIYPSLLSNIIKYAPHDNNGQNVSLNIDNYSMNEFVPFKPFYYYTSKAFWDRNINKVDYVVVKTDESNCTINDELLKTLKSIIQYNTYKPKKGVVIYYNKRGIKKVGSDDNIYIDCQPIPPQGEPKLTDYLKKTDVSGDGATGISGNGPTGNSSFVDAMRSQSMIVLYVSLSSFAIFFLFDFCRNMLNALYVGGSKLGSGATKMLLKRRARKATKKASKATNKAIGK